mmetsp:Transcript_4436/g.10288  ORF Transcript_4436/g.10288 Transcript_4436/m.10288 type:complete len:86 (-) Transcript_4436:79-336(-)
MNLRKIFSSDLTKLNPLSKCTCCRVCHKMKFFSTIQECLRQRILAEKAAEAANAEHGRPTAPNSGTGEVAVPKRIFSSVQPFITL